MKHKTAFFCDVRGTFTSSSDDPKLRNAEMKRFISNLDDIRKTNNSDELIFSFISNDSIEYIYEFIEEMQIYKTESIILGKQFGDDKYLYGGKIGTIKRKQIKGMKIINYVKEMEQEDVIDEVIFADDSAFYINSFDIFSQRFLDTNYNYILVNDSINDLNNKIESINSLKKAKRV